MAKAQGRLQDNLNVPEHRRTTEAFRLEPVMTARKRNRARERTMAFLDENGNWVSAFVLVGHDGLPINMNGMVRTLEAVLDELRELNTKLEIIGESI